MSDSPASLQHFPVGVTGGLTSVVVGDRLALHSLVDAAHLNGCTAVCIGHSNGRLEVRVDSSQQEIRVKHINVRVLPSGSTAEIVNRSYVADAFVPVAEYVGEFG